MTQAQSTPLLFDGTRCRTKLLCVDGTVMHACTFLYQIWVFIFDKRLAMRIALAMQPTLFPHGACGNTILLTGKEVLRTLASYVPRMSCHGADEENNHTLH